MSASAFRIEAGDGDAWHTVAEVADNTQRRCVLPLPPTRSAKLRLVLTAMREDAAVCEIRVYDGAAGGAAAPL